MAFTTTTVLSSSDEILHVTPDGRYVSYVESSGNDQSLFVIDLDTGQKKLLDTYTPFTYNFFNDPVLNSQTGFDGGALSPNGDYIFYSTGVTGTNLSNNPGDTHFYIQDLLDGTPPVDVTPNIAASTNNTLELQPLAISNDSLTIVYAEFDKAENIDGFVLQTTGSTQTFPTDGAFVSRPMLSTDGRYFAYDGEDSALVVYDTQSQTSREYGPDISASSDVHVGAISSDGRYVVYQGSGTLLAHDNDAPSTPDQVVPTSAAGIAANGVALFVALSGDGRHVVFESNATNLVPSATDGNMSLYVKDLDSGAISIVQADVADTFHFSNDVDSTFISNDGSRIIFPDGSGNVVVTQFLKPTLTINPITGDNYVNAADGSIITISGTSDAIGQTIRLAISDEGLFGTAVATVRANGTWSTIISLGKLADGAFDVHATVTNELTNSVDRRFTIDRTPPSQVAIISVAGDDIINAAEIAHATVAGTVLITDPSGPGSVVGELQLKIDQGPSTDFFSQASTSTAVENFSHDINASGVADGTHTITLTAFDEAGNKTVVTKQVLIDTTPPKIAITSVSGDDVVDSTEFKSPQGVDGTSDAIGQTVTVLVDGVQAGQAVVQADGRWLASASFANTTTGEHDVTATVSDEAGNPARTDHGVFVDRGFSLERLSVGPNGQQGGGNGVLFPSLSADGTKLVFTGLNFNLMSTATGSFGAQVYVKDLTTGAVTFATPDSSDNSEFGAISQDGTKIVFVSNATLDPVNQALAQGLLDRPGYYTYEEDLADGAPHIRATIFQTADTFDAGLSAGQNLTQPLPVFPLAIANNGYDSVMDMEEGSSASSVTVLADEIFQVDVSEDVNGPTAPYNQVGAVVPPFPLDNNGHPSDFGLLQEYAPEFSADGSVVAFEARFHAEQPFTEPPGPDTQIYAGGTLVSSSIPLASSFADGTPMPFGAVDPALSADGNFVAFWSWGTDGALEAFVKNLTTGELKVASSDADGNAGVDNASGTFTGGFNTIAISADGRYVTFTSDAVLTSDDSGTGADLFVKDMQTGAIQRVDLPAGSLANDLSTQLAMRADGPFIAFVTSAALTPDDTNGTSDVYGISLAALNATPPQIAIDAVTGDDRINAAEISHHLTISGTSDAIGQSVSLFIGGGQAFSATVASDGTWSGSIDATFLSDGVQQFRATVTAADGATGSDGDLVTVDRVAPTVLLSTDKTHLAPGQTATITAAFSEGIGNVGNNFLSATGGTIGPFTFVNDHTLTATFTPTAGADTFTVTANPGTAFDFAGNPNTTSGLTAGLAFDGYLSGSFVFMDANGNGVYDDGEAGTTTDAGGNFVLGGGSGPLVLQGGFDIGTMLPFGGVLAAPEGFGSVTPLTTLAYYVQKEAGGDSDSLSALVNALAHSGQDENGHDIVAEAGSGQAGAQNYLLSSVQVADAVALMASALAGAGGVPYGQAYADVMQDFAHAIVVNGASTDLLQQIPSIMSQLSQTYGIGADVAQNISDATNTIIHNIADALVQIPTGSDDSAFLTDLYGIARLAQGAASDIVGSPDAQTYDPFGTVTAQFTGEGLQKSVAAATAALAGEQAALQPTVGDTDIGLLAAPSVSFTIAGLDAEDTGTVTFIDANHKTITVNVSGGLTGYTADLSTLADGAITSSLQVNTDAAGNSFTAVAGTPVTLDRDAGEQAALQLTVGDTEIGLLAAPSVSFTIAGLDAEDTGTVTFTDANHQTMIVNVSGGQTSYTANLSSLADGTITSSLAVNTDAASNSFTAVAGTPVTLDRDAGEQAALQLTVGNTDIGLLAAPSVSFTIAGLDAEDTGTVTFTDANHKTITVNVSGGLTGYTADLSTLADGAITSSLQVNTDAANNSFTAVAGTPVTLDRDAGEQAALKLTVTTTAISAASALAVPFTVAGLDSEDTGTVTFTDVNHQTMTVNVSGGQTSYTANLSSLAGGTITTSLAVSTDVAGNDFIPVAGTTVTLTQLDPGPTAGSGAVTEGHGQTVSLSALIAGLITPGIAGDTETLTSVSAALGTATLRANNAVSYTAPAAGPDTISYTVRDQYGDSATGQVAVTVDPGPTAGNAHLYIAPGQNLNLTSLLLALDTPGLPGDKLSLTGDGTSGTKGKVTFKSGQLSYAAPASGSSDAFTYTVSDQLGDSANGTVAVTLDSSLLGNYRITLTGAAGSGNTIDAGNGNDQVALTGNNNTVMLGSGNDQVTLTGNADSAVLGNGNDQVALTGNNNILTLGGGNDNVTVSGNGNIVALGNGNDNVSLSGSNNTVSLGNGNDNVAVSGAGSGNSFSAGTGNDSFTLGGSSGALALHGLHDMVSINGGTDSITDTAGGADNLTLQVGALGGTIGVADFSITHGVLLLVQTLAASQGWTTPGQIDAALTTDNHGGSLLSLGSHGSVDFQGIAKSQLTANNFHIG